MIVLEGGGAEFLRIKTKCYHFITKLFYFPNFPISRILLPKISFRSYTFRVLKNSITTSL